MFCGADGFRLVEWGGVSFPGGVWVASRTENRLLIGQGTGVNALLLMNLIQ